MCQRRWRIRAAADTNRTATLGFDRPSAEIGFDDPTTFHRAFKKWTGSTPGAYRPKA
jgi:AraC-like DNA-binding protein